MLTYTDFCLKLATIIKEEKIESLKIQELVNDTLDQLEFTQTPIDTYEEVISKELKFYKSECQYMNQLRTNLQLQVKQLQTQLFEEKETNIRLIEILKSQKKQQLQNNLKTETNTNTHTQKLETQRISSRLNKEQFTTISRQPILPITQKQSQYAPHLTIEIKNIRTPLIENQTPKNLKELFEQCVAQLYRENKIKGNFQKQNKQNCNRDHQGQFLLTQESNDVQFSKLDIKTLTERFFLNPHFIKMVEAQIFDVKCCNYKACIYNQRQIQLQFDSVQQKEEIHQTHLQKRSLTFRQQDNRSKSVGKNEDYKLQYQYLYQEIQRLEKEIVSTSTNRFTVQELKFQLKEAKDKLVEIQSKILN
ncbi:unnamed protein product [Paramecium pentaurelia]|uniref:Uncharacterized protein n=1 Tax=Paramecium pentaurelia TaxID=43138 RepID=A0A8S1T5P7_9CILI|nr:unnamed protein product [Paramecium pentaurelia]